MILTGDGKGGACMRVVLAHGFEYSLWTMAAICPPAALPPGKAAPMVRRKKGNAMAHGIATSIGAMAIVVACHASAAATGMPADGEMREAHAVLLGLAQDGAEPKRAKSADIYASIVDNPNAPRLVTRLEVSGAPCRARTISSLQFPGKWATLTLGLVDLGRITSVTAYGSVDDMIAETNPVPIDAPEAEQVVLTGEGLFCSSRLSLEDGGTSSEEDCPDRLDLPMMDPEQKSRARRALAIVAGFCNSPAFQKK